MWSILSIILMIGLAFVLEVGGLKWDSYFKPQHENVRRETFEATRSYNEAKLQQLSKYRLEYLRATDEVEKQAIASTVRHTFANYDKSKLPYELSTFLAQVAY